MPRSFLSLIWSNFLRVQVVIIGSVSIVLAFLLWHSSPSKNIPLGLVLPIGVLCVILILILGFAAHEAFKMSKRVLPRVLLGRKSPPANQKASILCLLEPSELFSYDALVSFYYIHEGFEELIGIGRVLNIQEDGRIQVIMTHSRDAHEETVKKLGENNVDVLKKTIVKPSAPQSILDVVMSKGG